MNCSDIQERLSPYHDGELPAAESAQVASHIADCCACAEELARFRQLADLSQQLTDPRAPDSLWRSLQSSLAQPAAASEMEVLATRSTSRVVGKYIALAASLVFALGLGVVAYQSSSSPEEARLAMNFDRFLREFAERPNAAQQRLLQDYRGRPVTLVEASRVLGYEPQAANGLPENWTLEEMFLLEMPCCTCSQVMCRNEQGRSIAIFEHEVEQPIWFGDRAAIKCSCRSVPTSVIQMDDGVAASWRSGARHITIVGATDLEQVAHLVARFQR